ncbi:MAG: hypothetical protein MI808_16715 [Pseudomonadales bacterium]|nr:hypothetical protein [Pseudomonadales bacterium]
MKKILLYSLVTIVNVALNFVVFTHTYNTLATPYLMEEQRVDNAAYILSYTILGFLVVAVLTSLVLYFLGRNKPR